MSSALGLWCLCDTWPFLCGTLSGDSPPAPASPVATGFSTDVLSSPFGIWETSSAAGASKAFSTNHWLRPRADGLLSKGRGTRASSDRPRRCAAAPRSHPRPQNTPALLDEAASAEREAVEQKLCLSFAM